MQDDEKKTAAEPSSPSADGNEPASGTAQERESGPAGPRHEEDVDEVTAEAAVASDTPLPRLQAPSAGGGGGAQTPPTGGNGAAPPPGSRAGSAGLWLALLDLLAIVALAALGYLALQRLENERHAQQQSLTALNEAVDALEVRRESQRLWVEQVDERDREQREQLRRLTDALAALEGRQAQADEAVSKLSVKVQGGQHTWQRAEIRHLLLIANDRLQLQRDLDGARKALQMAAERLGQLNDPAYWPVRAAVEEEIGRLDAVPRVDLPAMVLKLGSLAGQVDRLSVRAPVSGVFLREGAAAAPVAGETAWYHKVWQSVREALGGLVAVRRDQARREPLLPPDQEFFLRQNLRLQLESARLAALERDSASYNAALRQAETWLQDYFDRNQPGTRAMLKTLRQLQGEPLKPALPDISGSLRALGAVESDA